MRMFYDLSISVNILTEEVLKILKELGYSGVGASISLQNFASSPRSMLKILEETKKMGEKVGLDVVSRLSIDISFKEMAVKRFLRKWRRKFELITVNAVNRQLTAFASRDTRIDILTLTPGARLLRGDLAYIKEYGKRVEFLLTPLQEGGTRERARVIAYYADVIGKVASAKLSLSIIISSGATRVEQFRDPRSIASLFYALGLSYEQALDAVSRNAMELVKENREKLKGLIPARGVKIVNPKSLHSIRKT